MNIHQRKLVIVGSVVVGGHKYARAVRRRFILGDIQLTDTIHHNMYPEYPFNDERAIRTFDHCVDLHLFTAGGHEVLSLDIWEGDSFNGAPIRKQSTYTLEAGDWWTIEGLPERVQAAFEHHCSNILREQEEAARAKKVRDIGLDLLSKIPGPYTKLEK